MSRFCFFALILDLSARGNAKQWKFSGQLQVTSCTSLEAYAWHAIASLFSSAASVGRRELLQQLLDKDLATQMTCIIMLIARRRVAFRSKSSCAPNKLASESSQPKQLLKEKSSPTHTAPNKTGVHATAVAALAASWLERERELKPAR